MKILVVLLLCAFTAAEKKREADPKIGLDEYGYGLGPFGYGPGLGSFGYGPGYDPYEYGRDFSQFGYGPGFDLGHYGYGPGLLQYGLVFGNRLGYGYIPAVPSYPSAATPFSNFNLHSRHRREADPSLFPFYGTTYPALPYGYGPGGIYGFSNNVQHPGYGYSFQQRSGIALPSFDYYY